MKIAGTGPCRQSRTFKTVPPPQAFQRIWGRPGGQKTVRMPVEALGAVGVASLEDQVEAEGGVGGVDESTKSQGTQPSHQLPPG